MHSVLQEQVVKHLTSKGVVLTPEFNEFLADVDKAYTSCDNDRQAFMENSQMLADAQMIAKIGSWTLNTETKEITWSDELYRIFEVDKDTFNPTYENFLAFVHPEDRSEVETNWAKTVAGENINGSEFRIIVGDNLTKWVQSRIYSADGNLEGKTIKSIGTLQDVTDRKNLEQAMNSSNERLRLLFDYAPDGYFLISESGVIMDVNRALETITGLNKSEMVGRNILTLGLIDSSEEPLAKEILNNVTNQKESPLAQFNLIRKDGSRVVVENRGFPLVIQGEKFGLSTVRDITNRKKSEEDLKRRAEELERLNKLMIGRELKMVELKNENTDLKNRAGLK